MLTTIIKPKISTGNTKLADTFIWSLPPIKTCPGATEQCKKDCYAMKAYRQYPSAKSAWDYNWDIATGDPVVFVETISEYLKGELSSKRKTRNFKYFRIHESGDFFNQKYLDAWKTIASLFPSISFLAYTKSGWLDFSDLPDNMVVRMSIWEDSNPLKVNYELPRATMEGMDQRKGAFHCQPSFKCADCRFCWASTKDVYFTKH